MITVSILGIKFLEWIWNFAVYDCNITQQKIHKSLQQFGVYVLLLSFAKMKIKVACNILKKFVTVSLSR